MARKLTLAAVAVVSLLIPTPLLAGGPPWLCLPIDGVTAQNADACTKRLCAALDRPPEEDGVTLRQVGEQWYVRAGLGQDVTLGEIEDTLEDSEFSVPRDRLRLFGHVILEIATDNASPDELAAVLEAMEYVAVSTSKREGGVLLVTVDMPYPMLRDRQSVAWSTFARNDLSTPSGRSEPPATARMLPSFNDFRDVVAKHNAGLTDIRWSVIYACRPLGCVAVAETNGERGDVAETDR